MPKKFANENTKAVQARERKKEKTIELNMIEEKKRQDAIWVEEDKKLLKKCKKKDEMLKKKENTFLRKEETRKMYEKEQESIKTKNCVKKLTNAQIERNISQTKPKEVKIASDTIESTLSENMNRAMQGVLSAKDVSEAIKILEPNNTKEAERHPEKRVKSAYLEFEEDRLKSLKVEFPNLRLSQHKQMLKKEWKTSSNNPLNKEFINYNAKL